MTIAPRTVQSSPNLPPMQGVDPRLTNYLHSFALWARHGFADKLSGSTAQPGIMLLANDAPAGTTPKVFRIEVTTAGTIVATPVPIAPGQF
jgi:hypothetical protein